MKASLLICLILVQAIQPLRLRRFGRRRTPASLAKKSSSSGVPAENSPRNPMLDTWANKFLPASSGGRTQQILEVVNTAIGAGGLAISVADLISRLSPEDTDLISQLNPDIPLEQIFEQLRNDLSSAAARVPYSTVATLSVVGILTLVLSC